MYCRFTSVTFIKQTLKTNPTKNKIHLKDFYGSKLDGRNLSATYVSAEYFLRNVVSCKTEQIFLHLTLAWYSLIVVSSNVKVFWSRNY